ncbi:MAG: hypothetical protein AAF664_21370 [Planctomycetota bacterium]
MRNLRQLSIRTTLVAIALFAFAAQWWNGVPRRTAKGLADAISERDADRVKSLCGNINILDDTWALEGASVANTEIELLGRSFPDFIMGRQTVELRFLDNNDEMLDVVGAEVTRFHISKAWNATRIFSILIAISRPQKGQELGHRADHEIGGARLLLHPPLAFLNS